MRKLLLLFSLIASFSLQARTVPSGGDSDFETSDDATHIPAMILVSDADVDDTIADLEAQGITILRHRGEILLAFIPVGWQEQSTRQARGVKNVVIGAPRKNLPLMDKARGFNEAFKIADGVSLPRPFTGKGVVVGVCDIGLDSRHPNFLDSEMKESRIRKVVQYNELQGQRREFNTPEKIYDWHTDNDDEWHATHVTGIAAGAHKESGFYGLAPDADIVFTASQLSDVGLLAGVEDIIDYAKEVGKPAVINLSMGNYVGPHDGSSLFTRYLDMCADDAIICVSSGNSGDKSTPCSMSFDFTEEKTKMKVGPNDYGGKAYYAEVDVWSADATPFDLSFYWRSSTDASQDIEIYPSVSAPDGGTATWSMSVVPGAPDYDETFAKYFYDGYVTISSGISYLNGRYCTHIEFELYSDYLHPGSSWAEYWAGIKVEGKPGTHVDIFCGGNSFLRRGADSPAPDNNLCVSDLATGFHTISVGMMCNRDQDPNAAPGAGLLEGEVCNYSSYATLSDKRVFPLTCAPGAMVISSISSPYLDAHSNEVANTAASSPYNGGTVYWAYNTGTSMSCPYVAGAIATWLQAYPQLTADKAIEIIRNTNQTTGYPYPENPRHGQGWFNPYKGLQDVLTLAALNVPEIPGCNAITMRLEGNELHVANPGAGDLTLTVTTPSGVTVERRSLSGGIFSVPLAHLSGGLYLLTVSASDGSSTTLKAFIR